jgi:hypothetical protein
MVKSGAGPTIRQAVVTLWCVVRATHASSRKSEPELKVEARKRAPRRVTKPVASKNQRSRRAGSRSRTRTERTVLVSHARGKLPGHNDEASDGENESGHLNAD